MDRRHAADRDIAEVGVAIGLGPDRERSISHVGDRPRAVADVQGARLARDVGRGEMVMQERPDLGIAIFRDHPPRVVVEEAIDHHPVKPGQRAIGSRRALAQRHQIARPFEHRRGGIEPGQHIGRADGRARDFLEFDDLDPRRPVKRHIIAPVPELAHPRRSRPARPRRHVAMWGDIVAPHQRVDRRAQPRIAEHRLQRARPGHDALRRRIDDQHQPVRLDRPWHMDRLPIARGQLCPQHSIGLLTHVPHSCSRYVSHTTGSTTINAGYMNGLRRPDQPSAGAPAAAAIRQMMPMIAKPTCRFVPPISVRRDTHTASPACIA